MSGPSKAIFLSYASQDAVAAQRIADALGSAGMQVWFDRSELRGGDAWERQISTQIHSCALFIAVISAHTDARSEGYFRREWRVGVERTRDMADAAAFLLPVVIDATADATARVPDRFREVPWTRLPGGQTSYAFVEQVMRLLSPVRQASPFASQRRPSLLRGTAVKERTQGRAPSRLPRSVLLLIVVALLVVAYLVVDRLLLSKRTAQAGQTTAPLK